MYRLSVLVMAVLALAGLSGCCNCERSVYNPFQHPVGVECEIRHMRVGDIGYAVPWALSHGNDDMYALSGHYTVHREPGGTVTMKVTRTAGGYTVDVTNATYHKWSKGHYTAYTADPRYVTVVEINYRGATYDKLPPQLFEREIQEMRVGENGWAVPWALDVSPEGKYFLRPTYSVDKTPGGTVQMLVTRTAKGFVVDVSSVDRDNTWTKSTRAADGLPVEYVKGGSIHVE